jgi:hypothetical protein
MKKEMDDEIGGDDEIYSNRMRLMFWNDGPLRLRNHGSRLVVLALEYQIRFMSFESRVRTESRNGEAQRLMPIGHFIQTSRSGMK